MRTAEVLRNRETGLWFKRRGEHVWDRQDARRMTLGEAQYVRRTSCDVPEDWEIVLIEVGEP